MKPDIIVTWPRNTDYPLWRQMIRDNRNLFNEVIIVFMETNQGDDYRQFIRDAMFQDHALFVESPPVESGRDWRDVAVNAGLMHSLHSEWIWFTEQDFFFKDITDAWEALGNIDKEPFDFVGVKEGERLHPCCLFLRRSVLPKISRSFGANPPEFDHFGRVQKDLDLLQAKGVIIHHEDYVHMAGLSHNMRLVSDGQQPNHQVELFREYLAKCLEVTVPVDPRFIALANSVKAP